jgi:hypothetical protein
MRDGDALEDVELGHRHGLHQRVDALRGGHAAAPVWARTGASVARSLSLSLCCLLLLYTARARRRDALSTPWG